RSHAEDAVLAVQDDLASLRQEVGDQRRQANTEIDVSALRDIARDARSHLFSVELFHQAAFLACSAMRTMRFTKMPGVTTASGSSEPSSTASLTCTTVHFAAAAM